AKDDKLTTNENFAAYKLIVGASQPLNAGDMVTLNLYANGVQLSSDNVSIESASGVSAELVQDFVDRSTNKLHLLRVQRLAGKGPYRVRVTGMGDTSYTLQVDNGDELSGDKGTIVVDSPATRDSSRSPQVIGYDIIPQVGKNLVEGDQITVSFDPDAGT